MGEWRKVVLRDIADVRDGTHDSPKKNLEGKFLVTSRHIKDGKIDLSKAYKISEKDFEQVNRRSKVDKWDILFSMIGTIGEMALIDYEPNFAIKNVGLFKTGNDDLARWIYYYFKSDDAQNEIFSSLKGSTQEYITLGDLRNFPISFPPLPEQKAIASVLSSLDDKIDLLHRQNKTLEAMAETLFRQWFVEEARDDWEEGCLGDAIELFDHLRVPLSKMERDKRKTGKLYPYYGAAKIMDYINDYIFEGDYILLGEDGTVRTEEGFPILQYATGKFWVNNHTHVLKSKKPYSNFFIWNYLKKKNIDEIVTGAVQPKINQGNLKSLDFPNYPKDLVENFNCQTEPLFKKINQNRTQIRTLEKLRDTLLPKLMSGEVRVEYEH